jgi:membrane protease YdiL (CAAX protease family)
MNARFLGLVLVAVVAWNAAFAVAPHYGIFLAVGVAALVGVARAFAVPTPWRALLSPRVNVLIVAAAATALLVCATVFFREPVLAAFPAFDTEVRALYALFGVPSAVEGYLVLPLIAIAEELIFRGAIEGGLEARYGPYGAAFGAAVIYACGHLASHLPVLVALAFALGLFWGLLRARTRSLWPGIASHVIWDLLVVVWSPLAGTHVFHV